MSEQGVPEAAAAPSPALCPSDVVVAQLAGMRREPRHGDGAGPGVQTVWAFSSPGNRAATGPLDAFAAILRSPLYRGLLEHRAAQLGPLLESGDQAQQEVLVLTAEDRAIGFTWVLTRQAGCWLTEGVLRHPDRSGPDDGDPGEGDR